MYNSIVTQIQRVIKVNMLNKKTLVLNALIKRYINLNEPTSSADLKELLDVEIAASTIRVYFRQMSNDGVLYQYHTSGGRVPTLEALRCYWSEYFENFRNISLNNTYNIEVASEKFGIYFLAQYECENFLQRVINVEDNFLILKFTNEEMVMQYNAKLEGLFFGLLNNDIEEIRNLLQSVGVNFIVKKIDLALKEKSIFSGEKHLYRAHLEDNLEIDIFRNISIFKNLPKGLMFDGFLPQNYMVVHKSALINGQEAKFIALGEISNDFDAFFKEIA